jgi:hypothetical protein
MTAGAAKQDNLLAYFLAYRSANQSSSPDHHLGAGGPQGRRPVVFAADHGVNRKPAMEEQAGHGSPDRSKLTGCPGYEDRPDIGHATSLRFAEQVIL